jgi:hypothetical protein
VDRVAASTSVQPILGYNTTDIRTMVHVWVGKLSLEAAVRSELVSPVPQSA